MEDTHIKMKRTNIDIISLAHFSSSKYSFLPTYSTLSSIYFVSVFIIDQPHSQSSVAIVIIMSSSSLLQNVEETIKVQAELHRFEIFKFNPAYLLEVCVSGIEHISLAEYRQSCLVPEVPKSVYFTDNPYEIDTIVLKELSQEPVTAFDFETCSWSSPFCTWPDKFQSRFSVKPTPFTSKGT